MPRRAFRGDDRHGGGENGVFERTLGAVVGTCALDDPRLTDRQQAMLGALVRDAKAALIKIYAPLG